MFYRRFDGCSRYTIWKGPAFRGCQAQRTVLVTFFLLRLLSLFVRVWRVLVRWCALFSAGAGYYMTFWW